jgi:hypothetical protein
MDFIVCSKEKIWDLLRMKKINCTIAAIEDISPHFKDLGNCKDDLSAADTHNIFTSGANFINIRTKVFCCSFSLVTFWLCNFLAQEY